MEHSKGPWETDGRVSPAGAGYLDIVCPKGRIAMMDCEDDAFWAAELEANANLIAAAPDLLAALENMERILWDLACYVEESRQEPEKEAIDACVAARRLIAKAKAQP